MNLAPSIISQHDAETGTWTYVLADPDVGVAAMIDPVWGYDAVSGDTNTGNVDKLLEQVKDRGWSLEWVLETHAHADHLSAAMYVREQTGASIAIGRGIRAVQAAFIRIFNLDDVAADGSQFDRLLGEGDVIQIGALEIKVMETPGHTSDSLTYCVADCAFVGDTLFAPGFGTARCDFPGGDAAMLFDSIARKHGLPGATRLFLCHDYPGSGEDARSMVTVAESRASNIHARDGIRREEYIDMRETRDAKLSLPRLIYPALQVNIRGGKGPEPEQNQTAYLRIPFNADIEALLKEQPVAVRGK